MYVWVLGEDAEPRIIARCCSQKLLIRQTTEKSSHGLSHQAFNNHKSCTTKHPPFRCVLYAYRRPSQSSRETPQSSSRRRSDCKGLVNVQAACLKRRRPCWSGAVRCHLLRMTYSTICGAAHRTMELVCGRRTATARRLCVSTAAWLRRRR